MQEVLLDSDILSEILKGKNPQVAARQIAYAAEFPELTFTSASVLEILYGLYLKGARAQLERAEALFAMNHELAPSPEDYRLAAEISGAVAKQGKPIGLIDPLIAACAIRRGLGVAAGNTAHFGYIRKLGYQFPLENWREP